MLRIPCSCGKDLKVTEALLGRKIKCPACGKVQVARDPSLPVLASGSRTSPDADDDFAAPSAGKKDKASPDAAPGKKKPTKKGGMLKWLVIILFAILLLGGGTVAGLYFGANIKVWELVTGGPAKASPKKSGVRKPLPDDDQLAIKLFVPHKVGEKREMAVAAEVIQETAVEGTDVKDEMRAAVAEQNFTEKVVLKCLVETLAINDQGEETKIKLTVTFYDRFASGAKRVMKDDAKLTSDTELFGTMAGGRWAWTSSTEIPATLSSKLSDCLSPSFFREPESAADSLFGTAEKRAEGDTWPINKEAIVKHLQEHSLLGKGPKNAVVEVEGTGAITEITAKTKRPHIPVEITMKVSESAEGQQLNMDKTVLLHLPRDGVTGPFKKKDSAEVKKVLKSDPNTTITSKITESVTSETTYLSGRAEEDLPLPKGKGDTMPGKDKGKDKDKTPDLASLRFGPGQAGKVVPLFAGSDSRERSTAGKSLQTLVVFVNDRRRAIL